MCSNWQVTLHTVINESLLPNKFFCNINFFLYINYDNVGDIYQNLS